MPFKIIRNDISQMDVDAIVNSANPQPIIGGGVDFAIHEAGGDELIQARKELGQINVGQVKYTPGYNLKSRFVFHTVGPVWNGGTNGEDEDLYKCYFNALNLAKTMGLDSIAFPLLSSGVFNYPKEESLNVATRAIKDFLEDYEMTIYMVVLDHDSFVASKKKFGDIRVYVTTSGYRVQVSREERARKERRIIQHREEIHYSSENKMINELEQLDQSFRDTLFELIKARDVTDPQVYKKANIDRRLFSKIRNNPKYNPSKNTAIALAIALELNLTETRDLIGRAGYTLTQAFQFDAIIIHYIRKRKYDFYEINETLFDYDEELLGSQ